MNLNKKEINALNELVYEKIKAMVDADAPYPEVVLKFWLPLLKKLGGES